MPNWHGVTSKTPNFMFGGVMVGGLVMQPAVPKLLYIGTKAECEVEQKRLKRAQKNALRPAVEESISDMALRLTRYEVASVYVSLTPIVLH